MVKKSEDERIKKELAAVGVSEDGLTKPETEYLGLVVQDDEHIGGVVYGRYENGGGVLVATNKRLFFLDHKASFKVNDEINYDVLSGVSSRIDGRFASVIVHTRLGDYTIRFVKLQNAAKFVQFIETMRVQKPLGVDMEDRPLLKKDKPNKDISPEVKDFMWAHEVATLSTIDDHGNVRGAAVYYFVSDDNKIYMVTKAGTEKARNITGNSQVALTVFDAEKLQIVQLQGLAEQETDLKLAQNIVKTIIKPRLLGKKLLWPPITKILAGTYQVIRIDPSAVKFSDYSK